MEFLNSLHGAAHQGNLNRLNSFLKNTPVDKIQSGFTALSFAAREGQIIFLTI
jgi:ankyrin repeat protein